ncbi:MAG: biotin--[acetyl-CoA-carboxylase] ligase [Vicinamibacteria bacterium]|nr:biotin--[acetyl-CoA-carboxylase] ligase [Vicinamibacteria bacterium]
MTDSSYSGGTGESATVRRLLMLLDRNERRWPAPIEHHRRIDSTNRRLKEWSRAGAPDRAVVIADEQTAGAGRRGRVWFSPPGNVYLSLLLRGDWAAERPFLVPLTGGVAVARALTQLGLRPRLKWPNDVLVGDRKIAGLLAESVMSPRGLDSIVLGAGVNVRLAPDFDSSSSIDRATTLRDEAGVVHDRLDVAATVLARMAECYDALARNESEEMLMEWRRFSVHWWGRLVEAYTGEKRVVGVMEDLGEQGELILRLQNGSMRKLYADEARRLRISAEDGR